MPARLSKIKRSVEKLGGIVEKPSGGSHWKLYLNGTMYILSAHNGTKTEITDHYISGLCRAFGLDEEEFRGRL